jgi:hypothetical protein
LLPCTTKNRECHSGNGSGSLVIRLSLASFLSIALSVLVLSSSILRWESVHHCRSIDRSVAIDSGTPTNVSQIQQLPSCQSVTTAAFFLITVAHPDSTASSSLRLLTCSFSVRTPTVAIEVLRFIVGFSGCSKLAPACTPSLEHPSFSSPMLNVSVASITCNTNRL